MLKIGAKASLASLVMPHERASPLFETILEMIFQNMRKDSCLGCAYCQGPVLGEARWCNALGPLVDAPTSMGGPYRPRVLTQLVCELDDRGHVVNVHRPEGWPFPLFDDADTLRRDD